jgi:hypothetical protein
MAAIQGLKNLGLEKGKPFNPTAAQQKILEEAALVGETWAMGNSFLKPIPVKHWKDDPKSQWQFILFMESPLDQMAKTHMEIDARTAYNGAVTTRTTLLANEKWGIGDKKHVEQVTDGVYAMRGWGIASSFAIEAPKGWIIIDTGDFTRAATSSTNHEL